MPAPSAPAVVRLARNPLGPDTLRGQLLLAVVVTVAAGTLRWGLAPVLAEPDWYPFALAAIAVAAWLGSWKAGAIAGVLCHALAVSHLIDPAGAQAFGGASWSGSRAYYAAAAVMLAVAGAADHRRRALVALVDTLRAADARKTEFLALLAHELRNPLATVQCGVELLKLTTPSHDPESVVFRLDRQVGHMTRLVEDLLDIARVEQGKIRLKVESLPIEVAIRDAVSAATVFTLPKGQQVAVDVAPGSGRVQADPARVAQVLGNLLHNASKFSPPGSTIRVRAWPCASHVAVSVVDSGMGIASDQLEPIFGSFVQVNPGVQAGLGLGLALVRKLMELQGGTVQARSEGVGKGAEFMLTFPAACAAVAEPAGEGVRRYAPPARTSCAVVDPSLHASAAAHPP